MKSRGITSSVRLTLLALGSTLVALSVQAAKSVSVVQQGLVFAQKSAALSQGDTMIYQNHDDVIHNIHIFKGDEDRKDLGLQKPGVPLSYRFDESGTFTIRCNIHPSMKMTVTVK